MIQQIIPKLPMRQKEITERFYNALGFETSQNDFHQYLMMKNGAVEIHFFEFKGLIPEENYGQIYVRCSALEALYQHYTERGIEIHPAGSLSSKPWGQKEFSILDPDHNLITFGEAISL
ncbi:MULTISPECIES: bleomycin resistance protein [Chryseobacterium]|uniref:Glyoxalase/fosfomycin resistance/dioxygenase domain-containing protein n=1 Tax=Chryseobacterium camelliae TaxID=1265445 RepID=A0ABU0THB2_9FLAO|nr:MULTISPECIES: VOC family protein [Chryseobacterium]MDT3406664.1 hypothetical protein [Pseudacidovorax intermedius]MDQ1095538.1 hypothetical protein [Chryseobacterium camelliae]MDQ1099476.1 hypothetical protein [Chryseobacterium sp. SORGH_AS_1048]MDR6086821.1 hypothetical protein [Chryseobacterium sp. SORGH_AS_0909]MDR6131194.1 hypothetical protein [Chryseobacterium sp. SORGH_AS_1175]